MNTEPLDIPQSSVRWSAAEAGNGQYFLAGSASRFQSTSDAVKDTYSHIAEFLDGPCFPVGPGSGLCRRILGDVQGISAAPGGGQFHG